MAEGKISLLLVEDDEVIRELIRLVAQSLGFFVGEARNGQEAKEVLEQVIFDAVLTDYQMPKMNGLELVRWIRSQPALAKVVVVVCSGEDIGIVSKDKGADMFLPKPLSLETLNLLFCRIRKKVKERKT